MKRKVIPLLCTILFLSFFLSACEPDYEASHRLQAEKEYQAELQAEHERAIENAYSDGYSEGYNEGYEDGRSVAHENDMLFEEAKRCLQNAMEIVDGPMIDPDVPTEDYYDELYDNICDALAWLEKAS